MLITFENLKSEYMPMLSIRIHRQNDPKPAFPELKVDEQGEFEGATIMEGGMQSGKTAVGFHVRTTNGKIVWFQTSAEILNSLVATIRGAEANWIENPVENIWNKENPPTT